MGTVKAIEKALAKAGVEFLEADQKSEGVRLRKPWTRAIFASPGRPMILVEQQLHKLLRHVRRLLTLTGHLWR